MTDCRGQDDELGLANQHMQVKRSHLDLGFGFRTSPFYPNERLLLFELKFISSIVLISATIACRSCQGPHPSKAQKPRPALTRSTRICKFSQWPHRHQSPTRSQQISDHISSIGYGVAVTSLTLTSSGVTALSTAPGSTPGIRVLISFLSFFLSLICSNANIVSHSFFALVSSLFESSFSYLDLLHFYISLYLLAYSNHICRHELRLLVAVQDNS